MGKPTYAVTSVERRRRNRAAMVNAILEAAIENMREDGVTGLSLHEVGRRVGMRAQSLYKYFPSKSALYDALYQEGARRLLEHDRRVWASAPATWDRLRAWFDGRLAFAEAEGPLYELTIGASIPEFIPSAASVAAAAAIGEQGTRAMAELVEAGVISRDVSPRQAINMMLAASRGIIAETLGKQRLVAEQARFRELIPQFVEAFRSAWSATRELLQQEDQQ